MTTKKTSTDEIIEQHIDNINYLDNELEVCNKTIALQKSELERLRTSLSASCRDVVAKDGKVKGLQEDLRIARGACEANSRDAIKYLYKYMDADTLSARWQLAAVLLGAPYVYLLLVVLGRFFASHVSIIIR